MDVEKFVQNVKEWCARKGVKPTVALEESGAGKNLLGQLKNRGSYPSIERVHLLAQYLGCTVSDLLGEENVKAAAQEGSGLEAEFAKLFQSLSPEKQNEIIAEMLKRKNAQK